MFYVIAQCIWLHYNAWGDDAAAALLYADDKICPLFAFEMKMLLKKYHSCGFLNVNSFLNERYLCGLVKLPSVYMQTKWDFHSGLPFICFAKYGLKFIV